jgi:prepilin-type N-terminal cleavage/methylation domain-containing protein
VHKAGFTLLEMILSIAIIGIIAGLSAPVFVAFSNRQDIIQTEKSIADALRRAQQYSANERANSQWGVRFQAGSVTVFKGASYATRDATYDEVDSVPTTVTMSYTGEIVFSQLYGLPSTGLTQVLSSSVDSMTQTLTMNAKGVVDY